MKLKRAVNVVSIKLFKVVKTKGKKEVKEAVKGIIRLNDFRRDNYEENMDLVVNGISSVRQTRADIKKISRNTKRVYRGGKTVVKVTALATKTAAKTVTKATTNKEKKIVDRRTNISKNMVYKNKFKDKFKDKFKNKEKKIIVSIEKKVSKIIKIIVSKVSNSYVLVFVGVGVAIIASFAIMASAFLTMFIGNKTIPNIDNPEAIIQCMQSLDKATGKKLVRNYSTNGAIDENWKSVLSLTLAKYNNDLSEVNMDEVGTTTEWTGSYADIINYASETYNIDSALICAIIKKESDWNPNVTSSVGAKGLMQLMDGTAHRFGCYDSYNPRENILAGTKYLRYLYDMFEDLTLTIAAYNCGEGNVMSWGYTVPPYAETQRYVVDVSNYYNQYKAGVLEPEDGSYTGEITLGGNNFLSEAYNIINKVENDRTLYRSSFNDAIDKMNFTEEQIELAEAIQEADLYDEIFGEGYDYSFNITGSKVIASGVNGECNGIPLFIQYKEPWASYPYAGETIGAAGCGTTTMAMVASWASSNGKDVSAVDRDGDKTVNPIESADFATNQGYACNGCGSYNTVVTDYVNFIGCRATYTLDIATILTALQNNKPVVLNVGAGSLASGGHFLLAVGIKNGMVMLNDPGRESQCYAITGATYSPSIIASEIKNAWVIDLN